MPPAPLPREPECFARPWRSLGDITPKERTGALVSYVLPRSRLGARDLPGGLDVDRLLDGLAPHLDAQSDRLLALLPTVLAGRDGQHGGGLARPDAAGDVG